MTLEVPDIAAVQKLSPQEMRLEMACGLYARARLGKIAAAELAGVDLFTFQDALRERGVPSYTREMFQQDLETIDTLFLK